MRNLGTQNIETDRLYLRPFTQGDAHDMYTTWASDPDVSRFLTWNTHESEDVTRAYLAILESDYENPETYNWAMVLKENDVLIGSIGCHKTDRSEFYEPGYCIGKAFWGNGYTTEALEAIVDFMFNKVGVPELYCTHAKQNPKSGAVMRKIGFTVKGEGSYDKMDKSETFETLTYALTKENYDLRRK